MNRRRRARLLASAEPFLRPGEQIELATLARVDTTPRKVKAARTAAYAAAGAVTAATLGVAVVRVTTASYLVLTDQQLLFFRSVKSSGAPGEHYATVPRDAIVSVRTKARLFVKVWADIAGSDLTAKLTFPLIPLSLRASGREFAASLERTASPAAADLAAQR